MENKSKPASSETSQSDNAEKASDRPVVYFVGGFLLGLVAYAVVGASMESTHAALADLGAIKLAIVAAIPFVCGGLSVWLRDSFTSPLEKLVTSVATLIG